MWYTSRLAPSKYKCIFLNKLLWSMAVKKQFLKIFAIIWFEIGVNDPSIWKKTIYIYKVSKNSTFFHIYTFTVTPFFPSLSFGTCSNHYLVNVQLKLCFMTKSCAFSMLLLDKIELSLTWFKASYYKILLQTLPVILKTTSDNKWTHTIVV